MRKKQKEYLLNMLLIIVFLLLPIVYWGSQTVGGTAIVGGLFTWLLCLLKEMLWGNLLFSDQLHVHNRVLGQLEFNCTAVVVRENFTEVRLACWQIHPNHHSQGENSLPILSTEVKSSQLDLDYIPSREEIRRKFWMPFIQEISAGCALEEE